MEPWIERGIFAYQVSAAPRRGRMTLGSRLRTSLEADIWLLASQTLFILSTYRASGPFNKACPAPFYTSIHTHTPMRLWSGRGGFFLSRKLLHIIPVIARENRGENSPVPSRGVVSRNMRCCIFTLLLLYLGKILLNCSKYYLTPARLMYDHSGGCGRDAIGEYWTSHRCPKGPTASTALQRCRRGTYDYDIIVV